MGHTHELSLGESFYEYFNVKEREDGKGMDLDEDSPGYVNDDLDREIEKAEEEIAKEEAEGKFEEEYDNSTGYGDGVEVVVGIVKKEEGE